MTAAMTTATCRGRGINLNNKWSLTQTGCKGASRAPRIFTE